MVNRGRDGDELEDLQRRAQDERLDRDARQQAQREQAKLQAQNERLQREARQKEQREEAKRQLEERYPEKQQRAGEARGRGKGKLSPGLATSGSRQPTAATRTSAGDRQLAAKVKDAQTRADPGRRDAAAARPGKTARTGDRKQPELASVFGGTKSLSEARRQSDRGLKSRSRANTEVKPNRSRDGGGVFAQRAGGRAHTSTSRGSKSRERG